MKQKLVRKFFRKLFVFFSISLIILQSLGGVVPVLAQEAIQSEPVAEETITPTEEPTPTVTEEVTPEPSVEPTPEPEASPTDVPVVIESEPTPTIIVEEVTPVQSEPTEIPADEPKIDEELSPTPTTVEITPSTDSEGTLSVVIIEKKSADSIKQLNLDTTTETSASLITDKLDYAPTDVVLITGSNLLPETDYSLLISSTDPPAIDFSEGITTDSLGGFIHAYQLDGNYRPNYKVELKDSTGNTVATTTFTDSPISGCTNDSAGANDEPGQKDLTKMCADYNNLPTSVGVTWNWDDKGPGGNVGGNTGDACSLFDTDGDGLVNYSLCVIIDGDPSVYQSKVLYSCGDDKADRCTNPITVLTPSADTTCSANVQATDPFPAGNDYPQDSVASCNIALSDVGGSGVAELVDVCSYPSQQPNSDPSDCIVFKDNTGRLEVIKDLLPSSDTGLFNLQVDGVTEVSDVGDGGTTGEKVVNSGTRTVGETEGANTSLSNYTTTIVCKDLNGSGNIVAQSSNTGPLNVTVNEGDDIVCVITNTLQNATITVNKTLVPSDDPGKFNLQIDGSTAGTGANVGNSGTTGVVTVSASGQHTVSETAGTGTSLSDYTTIYSCNNNLSGNGASLPAFSVTANQNVICTFTNTRNTGSVQVNKLLDSDGNGTFETSNPGSFNWSLDGLGTNAMGTTINNVNTGNHLVNENSVANYHFVGWYLTSDTSKTCANTTNTTLPANVSVASGQTINITLCNARDTGTVAVHKDVQGPAGENITDTSNNFTVQLDSANSQNITDNGTVTYTNVPTGSHTVTESAVASGYTLYGISTIAGTAGNTAGLLVNVVSGQTTNVYVTNRQNNGTIIVVKDVLNPAGGPVSDSHSFTANVNPGNQSDYFSEGDNAVFTVNPGTYTVSENDDPDYDEQGCRLITGAPATGFNVPSGGQVSITCTNLQKKATINVTKDVLSPTNGAISDNHAFTAQLNNGNNQSFSETITAAYLVNPGNYSITELSDNNYDYVACTPDSNQTPGDGAQITVGSNTQTTVTCTNKQKNAQVTIVKDVRDPNGANVTDNTNFVVQRNGADNKNFSESFNAVYSLAPGTYTFSEIVTSGYTLNSINPNNDADVNNGTIITLNSGQNATITFTNYQNSGSISGKKLGDTDGNLNTTGDQSNLTGWTINLLKCSFDFTGCVLSATTSTNGSGYSFVNLIPGFYQVQEVLQSGWTNLTSLFQNVTVNPDRDVTGINFVNFENVSVTACKKVDGDGNIATINDQSNKSGWTVNLLTDGQITDTRSTDRNGCYTWTDLGPNHTYRVSEDTIPGWTNLTATLHDFGTAQGGSEYTYTFVNFENVSISGHKWNDLNGNGVWDQGEPALENWEINLSGASSDSTTTDANGEYSFSNLGPGTYTLSETIQSGWIQTYPANPTTHSVTAASGQNVTDKDFGNQGRGSITVHKLVDVSGNGTYVSGDDGDFTWTLDGTSANVMGSTVSDIPAGQHSVSENSVSNFHFAAWFPTGGDFSCTNLPDNQDNFSLPISVNVGANGITDLTICNARDTGTITVIKEVASATEDSGLFDLQIDEVTEKTDAQNGGSTGQITVLTGIHSVGEVAGTDTDLSDYTSSISCNDENESIADGTHLSDIQVNSGDNITCTITNARKNTIIVTKYNDQNGNGIIDTEDVALSGWEINLDDETKTTDQNGQVIFDDLVLGNYTLSENLQDGWMQTNIFCSDQEERGQSSNSLGVFVNAGQTVNCSILNRSLTPILMISKSNNTEGADLNPGSDVLYTITVSATQSSAVQVTVTDLLPLGINYRSGTWTAGSSVRGNLRDLGVTTEPTYHSPGVWNLGNMVIGEIVTLTLIANIDGGQNPGIYKDLALAQGTSLSGETVFALAQPQGFVDTNFVGTDVSVVKNQQSGISISINRQEVQVLGASTVALPATGASVGWAFFASTILLIGLNLIYIGYIMRKRYV